MDAPQAVYADGRGGAMTERTPTPNPYVWIDGDGKARLTGTGFKVRILADLYTRGGMTIDQLLEAYPHLARAKIHGGLAYYYEHKDAFDEEMERLDRMTKELMANAPPSEFAQRMRAEGRLR